MTLTLARCALAAAVPLLLISAAACAGAPEEAAAEDSELLRLGRRHGAFCSNKMQGADLDIFLRP